MKYEIHIKGSLAIPGEIITVEGSKIVVDPHSTQYLKIVEETGEGAVFWIPQENVLYIKKISED